MKRKIKIGLIIACICFGGNVRAQQISNVTSTVVGNDIVVQYNVQGLKFNQHLSISLYVSIDGGNSYLGPMHDVKGDIGDNISNGQHIMTWWAMKEMPFEHANAIFDVRAVVVSEKIRKSFFIAYASNLTSPLGVRIGQLGGLGWYIIGQSNTQPGLKGTYTYNDGTITDYNRFAWYEFTSNHKVSAYMACAGLTYQMLKNVFIYGGAGYGKADQLYELREYDYNGDTPLGTAFAKDNKASHSGIAVDAGVLFKMGKMTILGGASSVGFTLPDWQAGIGFCF